MLGLGNFYKFLKNFETFTRFVVSSPWMAVSYCLGVPNSPKVEVVYWLFQSIIDWLYNNDATDVVHALVYAKQVCYL